MDTPEAYLGNEPNTWHWTSEQWAAAPLKTLLQAPFDYLQGMGNSTLPLLYQNANVHAEQTGNGFITERGYFPTTRREVTMFEKSGMPIFGLETRHAMGDYDVVACTLSYPGYWFNVVKSFRMSGIPIRWRDRVDMKEKYPLIMVGGHIYASPWNCAPSVDIIWAGEAEDESLGSVMTAPKPVPSPGVKIEEGSLLSDNPGYNAVMEDLAKYKEKGMFYTAEGREDMLHELAIKYPFLFIPRFYTIDWGESRDDDGHWHIQGFKKKYPDLPDRIRKRFVRNLDAAPALTKPVIPFNDPGWMGTVQAARGCTYRCSFCAASFREAPYRERSQQVMVDLFRENIRNTGTPSVSPLILEFGTYSRKKALMKEILETTTDEFSMPALRIDVFGRDPVFGQLAVHAQKRNVTIAVEGNSQRMREVVSKGITEDDILKSVSNAIAAGYQGAKLYMICNLPGEDQNDTDEIVETCRKIDALRRSVGSNFHVRLSWKPLCIQAHTPFQWFRAREWGSSLTEAMREIKKLGFDTNLGDETSSSLGNYMQVAEICDDIAGEALLDMIEEVDGVTYGSLPRRVYPVMIDMLAKHGRTLDDYYREKHEDEIFAWDIIDTRITKPYLLRQYQAIVRRINNDPELPIYGSGFLEKFGGCQVGCSQCGACQDGPNEANQMFAQMETFAGRVDDPVRLHSIKTIDKKSKNQTLLMTIWTEPDRRFASRQHWTYVIRRALIRAGLTPSSDSFKYGTMRVKTMKPWFAGRQYVEFALVTPEPDVSSLISRLSPELEPYGITVEDILQQRTSMIDHRKIDALWWELEIDQSLNVMQAAVNSVRSAEYVKLTCRIDEYRVGEHNLVSNLKDVLHDLWVVVDRTAVKLVLLLDPTISPYDAANSIIGRRTDVYRYAAQLQAALSDIGSQQGNAFTPDCKACGRMIPLEFDRPVDDDFCPRCIYTAVTLNSPARDAITAK